MDGWMDDSNKQQTTSLPSLLQMSCHCRGTHPAESSRFQHQNLWNLKFDIKYITKFNHIHSWYFPFFGSFFMTLGKSITQCCYVLPKEVLTRRHLAYPHVLIHGTGRKTVWVRFRSCSALIVGIGVIYTGGAGDMPLTILSTDILKPL